MATPVPTLSTAGWVTAPADKADKLMAHVFAAMKSQTFLYGGNVTSVQDLVEKYGHKPAAMAQNLREAFDRYLRRYYAGVIVDVSVRDNGTPRYELRLAIQVTDDGKQYSFVKELELAEGKFKLIARMNNGQ